MQGALLFLLGLLCFIPATTSTTLHIVSASPHIPNRKVVSPTDRRYRNLGFNSAERQDEEKNTAEGLEGPDDSMEESQRRKKFLLLKKKLPTPTPANLNGIPDDVKCQHRDASPIIIENCKPGNPSHEWDVNGAGDPSIQGFSTDISYNVGQVAKFKVNTSASSFRVDVYRMGWYQGLGARKVATLQPEPRDESRFSSNQEKYRQHLPCYREDETMLYDCREWDVSVIWPIPNDAVSGVYIARLVRTDKGQPKTWRMDNSQAGEDPRLCDLPSHKLMPMAPLAMVGSETQLSNLGPV